jgi:hypothetical protein
MEAGTMDHRGAGMNGSGHASDRIERMLDEAGRRLRARPDDRFEERLAAHLRAAEEGGWNLGAWMIRIAWGAGGLAAAAAAVVAVVQLAAPSSPRVPLRADARPVNGALDALSSPRGPLADEIDMLVIDAGFLEEAVRSLPWDADSLVEDWL